MSMSTKLEDLPGGQLELEQDSGQNMSEMQSQPPQSNIEVNIKKKVRFEEDNDYIDYNENDTNKMSLLDFIKTEFTEENLLLLAIILLATMPSISSYIKSLPFVSQFASSDFTTSIATAVILFLLYIITKIYIVPKIKL